MASRNVSQMLAGVLMALLSVGVAARQATQPGVDAQRTVAPERQTAAAVGGGEMTATDPTHGATIAPRDILTITTLGDSTFSMKALVEADGTFQFADVGRVKAAGLTVRELETSLTSQLAGKWLINPHVTVELTQTASKRVLVGGRVRNPSPYPFSGRFTVMEAIVGAGSLAEDAGDRRVHQLRANPDAVHSTRPIRWPLRQMTCYVDLHKLFDLGDLSENYTLGDGDYVFVEKAQPFTITGEVKSAGQYAAHQGLTVQQAVALAGGLTDRAKSNGNGIKILRPSGGAGSRRRSW